MTGTSCDGTETCCSMLCIHFMLEKLESLDSKFQLFKWVRRVFHSDLDLAMLLLNGF